MSRFVPVAMLIALIAVGSVISLVSSGDWDAIPVDIPVGVGVLTDYGFDVDGEADGWPSMWGIGGYGWNGLTGAHHRSFVTNEPRPDFRDRWTESGFYPSDDPRLVDWQARKIMEAGFDYVILDWQGWGDRDLDGTPAPYIHQRMNDTISEWMRWFDTNPDAPLQFAIFVHIFPVELLGCPISASKRAMILDYVWEHMYAPRMRQVFHWGDLPLLVTGFEMGFLDVDYDQVTIRNFYVHFGEPGGVGRPPCLKGADNPFRNRPGPDDWLEHTNNLNPDGMAMIKPRWDEWAHYLAQHRTNWPDWKRKYVGGNREDPYLEEGLYDSHWNRLTELRDKGALNGVWVIAWNEYATKNYLEPDKGMGPCAVKDTMLRKTAHYIERLQAGKAFKDFGLRGCPPLDVRTPTSTPPQ